MPASALGMYTAEAEGGGGGACADYTRVKDLHLCFSFGSLWVKVEFHSSRTPRKAIRNRRES